jgi:uncharacterized protein YxjI
MSESLALVQSADKLLVQQQKEWTEIITDWETRNRYVISGPDGKPALYAGEIGQGIGAVLLRGFLKNKRPFTIEVRDPMGALVLKIVRPWTWFFSRAEIWDGSGTRIGVLQQRFALLRKRFTITDRQDREVAEIHGPLFHPWTFEVKLGEEVVGKITKQWSGFLKEAFTDADNFGIEMGPRMNADLRLLALGAIFLIDFLYFEDRN